MKIIQLLLIAALVVISSSLADAQNADLVVTNAKVWTVNSAQPTAQSIAVLNGRIVAIGSNADTRAYVGSKTRVIDANGKLVTPGFNDAHVHFLETGAQLSS